MRPLSAFNKPLAPLPYQRRKPEESVLHSVVTRNLRACLETAQERSEQGYGYPGGCYDLNQMLIGVFASTIMLSAFLVFWVQPLAAKMLLPNFGGSPAVWTTSMVFFQTCLLLGYGYAHLLTQRVKPRLQVVVHLCILLGGLLFLPIAMPEELLAGSLEWDPVLRLMIVLLVSIGLPFSIITATSPLLQVWFARTNHPDAKDPYFLYGASNLGSLLSLLIFPLLFEPIWKISDQSSFWAIGYGALAVLVVICFVSINKLGGPAASTEEEPRNPSTVDPITWPQRLTWVGYALIPSALLNSFSLKLSTDIAAAPLLWVIPLALYLLTFVIVFARKPWIPHRLVILLSPAAGLLLMVLPYAPTERLGLVLHLPCYFVLTLLCHGELVKRRPSHQNLTSFYLWMSFGGILGSALTALVAPHLFNTLLEYPLSLAACLLLLPVGSGSRFGSWKVDLGIAVATAALILFIARGLPSAELEGVWATLFGKRVLIAVGVISFLIYDWSDKPLRFALVVLGCITAMIYSEENVLERGRSFFGVYQISESSSRHNVFSHGTTVHGQQPTHEAYRLEPTAYYHREGPIGDVTTRLHATKSPLRAGIVGLGIGAMACHQVDGDLWDFFEIDPLVVHFARDSGYFSYLKDCPGQRKLIVGDARQTLAKLTEPNYDFLLIDAFSSDAIPIHLITKEAIELYMASLADDGVLVLHISNRYLDLVPVLRSTAKALDLNGKWINRGDRAPEGEHKYAAERAAAMLVALGRGDTLERLNLPSSWIPMEVDKSTKSPWTDERSSVLEAFK